MVGDIHAAVSFAIGAGGQRGHVAAAQHEGGHRVAPLAHVGVVARFQFEAAVRALAGHCRSGLGDDGGAVQVDGHAAVAAVLGRLSVNLYIFEIAADDLARDDVVEDEPGAVAAQVHRAGGHRVVVGGDVNVDGLAVVQVSAVELAEVHLSDALLVGVLLRAVGLPGFVPAVARGGDDGELGVAALALVVIHADVVFRLLRAVYADVFAVLFINEVHIRAFIGFPTEAVVGRFRFQCHAPGVGRACGQIFPAALLPEQHVAFFARLFGREDVAVGICSVGRQRRSAARFVRAQQLFVDVQPDVVVGSRIQGGVGLHQRGDGQADGQYKSFHGDAKLRHFSELPTCC